MIALPVSDEQRYIFGVNEAYDSIPMGISYSMRFSKSFSVDELYRAVEKCARTADIFASRCIVRDGRPYMEFMSYQKMDIPVFDFASEEDYQSFCHQCRTAKINNRDKLYYIFIFSVSGSYYHLHFIFNHLIFDGISGLLLSYRILDVLRDPGEEVKWYPFSAYLNRIMDYFGSEEHLSDKEFWEGRFLSISQCDYLFRELIDTDLSLIKSVTFQTSHEFKELLLEYGRKYDISPHILIVAVLAQIINEKTDCKRFYFEIPVLNRSGKNERNSIGAYEVTFPYVFDFTGYSDVFDLIQSVRRQSTEYYRHRNYDWISNINSEPHQRKYRKYVPQFSFSYFCRNQKPSVSFAELHHHQAGSDTLPMNLYISDYFDWQAMTFTYTYWVDFLTEEEVAGIHHDIEDRIRDIAMKTDSASSEEDRV